MPTVFRVHRRESLVFAAVQAVRWIGFGLTIQLLLTCEAAALGDERRIVDREPFDQLVLNQANNNAVLDVAPLDFPNRRPPANPSGTLTVEWLSKPGEPIELPWSSIAEVRLYEQMLLEQAQRLTAEKKFDEAFDYYAKLLSDYSSLPGVNEAANEYLRLNALQLYEAGELERALSVLASLYDRTPAAPGLSQAIDTVCNEMIQRQLRERDYAAARAVLDLWQTKFSALRSSGAAAWAERFEGAAQRQVVQGQRLFAEKQYMAARRAIAQALNVWPQHAEALELLAEIQRQNPSISVAVIEASPSRPKRRLDDWAAMRASRLVEPLLAELVNFTPEGGEYTSPYGHWKLDDTGLQLTLELSDAAIGSGLSADYLARFFLQMADPREDVYSASFAAHFAGASVEGNRIVHIDWTHPHVRPEALLQVPVPLPTKSTGEDTESNWMRATGFELSESDPSSTTFSALSTTAGGRGSLKTIVEQVMPNEDTAIAALLHGEVDVWDRVPPWYVERLRSAQDIRVGTYRLPTVHALIPNPNRDLAASREFRRALCYGIRRDQIVKQVFLGGEPQPGFEVLSGPFPAGQSYSDPLRYAYNSQVRPRPFEPRLAAILSTVAWSAVLDPEGKGGVELTELPKLVLAHPTSSIARIACETIALQLEKVGIHVDLLEFSADDLANGAVEYDLRYAELAVWEPVVDAREMLGPRGLVGALCSPHMNAALYELDDASNWKDVRSKLAEIHEIAYHDLPIVPLWQTENFFAYRSTVRGIGVAPVSLYQNVDDWRIEAARAGGESPDTQTGR